jgi:YrbI family 3-deoxy-D-manno-octulosonate 8-phosphate phosphatase
MILVTDCDGILTSPQLTYTAEGKSHKHFSVNDSLVVKLLQSTYTNQIEKIVVLTGDKEPGLSITRKRLAEIGLEMVYCPNVKKYTYIKEHFGLQNTIYFGDDIFDLPAMQDCAWSGTVANAPLIVKTYAKFVSNYSGGEGGFTDLVLAMLGIYFQVDVRRDIFNLVKEQQL